MLRPRRSPNSQHSCRVNVGASGFFLVGGRVFTSSGHVEDVSAFHAWQFAGMLRDPPHGEASCENGV